MAQLNKRGLRTAKTANDFYQFTSVINRELEYHEKIRIIEYMWQFAYADGTVSAHENHVLRKISELLYIPHGDYIAAKILGFPMMYKLSFREIGKLCGNAEQVPARSRSCFNESGLLNKKSFFICNHAFHRHSGGTPVHAKVEHPFRPLKSIHGFAKVRYRGLLKNANRAFCHVGADQSEQMGITSDGTGVRQVVLEFFGCVHLASSRD